MRAVFIGTLAPGHARMVARPYKGREQRDTTYVQSLQGDVELVGHVAGDQAGAIP